MVTVEKPDGSILTRNIPHVKKIAKEATNRWRNIPEESEEEDNEDIPEDNPDGQNEGPEQQVQKRRPARERRPRAILETMLYIELGLILYFILEVHIRVILSKEKEGCSVLMLC
jgi:hypothetical protein